jgi:hypothetical protein
MGNEKNACGVVVPLLAVVDQPKCGKREFTATPTWSLERGSLELCKISNYAKARGLRYINTSYTTNFVTSEFRYQPNTGWGKFSLVAKSDMERLPKAGRRTCHDLL